MLANSAANQASGVAGAYTPVAARSVIPKSIPVLLATEWWTDWIAAPRSRARPLGVSG